MLNTAILMTVYNRREKTLACLRSIVETWGPYAKEIGLKVFLTDDGCSDGTADAIREESYPFPVQILQGDGSLYWNGGMINSWKAALSEAAWDGYLWLNDDAVVLPEFWQDLLDGDRYCTDRYGEGGILVGSTKDADTGQYTYGGFIYTNKLTLKDQMLPPDGTFQPCEAAHGNITWVSADVVDEMGIFCKDYIHGGTDHDYTWLAHKAGFQVLVLPHYSAACRNDHPKDGGRINFFSLPLKERIKCLHAPNGLNLHNALLFSRRCFPWRYPIILVTGYFKAIFPKTYHRLYLRFRGVKPKDWNPNG